MGAESLEGALDLDGVEADIPGLDRLGQRLAEGQEPAVVAGLAAPVIDELVPGDTDDPRDGHRRRLDPAVDIDCGQESLRRQILGESPLLATSRQIGVNLRQGVVVEGQERRSLVGAGWRRFAHMSIVARGALPPTPQSKLLPTPLTRSGAAIQMVDGLLRRQGRGA
jgi:hypothetical protein